MKVAIITDVHGNASALKAVLRVIDERDEIDHIYCLGDMVGIGPDTNEVLDLLFSRNDLSMITGNHDEAVLAIIKGEPHPDGHIHVKEHHEWIAERMNQTFISKLEKLPRTIQHMFNNYSFFFTHYHMEPKKLDEHISQNPFSKIVEPNLNNLERLFKNQFHHLIGFGHHHPIHHFRNDQTIYLNPGSLGCNSEPVAPYAIVSIEDSGIQVNLEKVTYDNSLFLLSYKNLQVPEHEFIIRAFHGNQRV
ncbi:metallophosphoesterase family protein [Peribacillus butanolivorans]|uniref:Metallophosphoesterase n=1 Tax=Peribacillus butanolivorans TaxID=421767 RepID=A0AAX0RRF6_9BACI|nr:metallophosphoesterase family protein [Peribacillus butanolivorans]AXN39975.1 metallophosphoesterase [Peribacillus butanolivorans]KON67951.1 metallophosphoesterase [Peribacillus butanolivorans]PEJ31595.1 phosphodiesterase [Peribacillus butanolivorans]QNU06138.1 metallophosphoesterase family protein [Peribacillus butanolivorans]